MANVKITELTELAAVDVADNDVVPIVDVGGDTTKKITAASLRTSLAAANDFITYTVLNSNLDIVSSNADAYLVQLNANIDVVQDNVAALETRRSDNVFFTLNLTGADHANVIINDANVEPTSNNTYSLGAPDKVWKELYLGPGTLFIGNVTIAPNETGSGLTITGADASTTTIDTATSNVTASLNLLQDNVAAAESNVVSAETRLNANLDIVQDNVTILTTTVDNFGTSSNANAAALALEDAALQTRLGANVTALQNEDTALQARIAANALVAASNDYVTYTRLDANVSAVQDNVAAAEANIAAIIDGTTNFTGEVTMSDDLIVTGNLTVNGDTVTINTTNMDVDDTMIMLANGTTGSPANDIGILFNRGNQGNAAFFYDESATTFKISDTLDPKSNTSLSPVTAANLSVGILDAAIVKFDGTSVQDAISANVTTLTNEDTALQARLTTNVTAFTNEDTALQSRLTTNVTAFTNEDAAIEARRVANIAGAISTVLTSDLTADRVMITDGSGKISQSSGVTPTELGYLDGITLGTVAASKAVTADANGDVNFIREVDIDGNVTIGTNDSNTVTIVGKVDLGALS